MFFLILFCSFFDNLATSLPSKITSPEVGVSKLTSILPVVDLPQPDSPTKPKVSPLKILNDTPSTALTKSVVLPNTPDCTGKYFFKFLTCNNGSIFTPVLP